MHCCQWQSSGWHAQSALTSGRTSNQFKMISSKEKIVTLLCCCNLHKLQSNPLIEDSLFEEVILSSWVSFEIFQDSGWLLLQGSHIWWRKVVPSTWTRFNCRKHTQEDWANTVAHLRLHIGWQLLFLHLCSFEAFFVHKVNWAESSAVELSALSFCLLEIVLAALLLKICASVAHQTQMSCWCHGALKPASLLEHLENQEGTSVDPLEAKRASQCSLVKIPIDWDHKKLLELAWELFSCLGGWMKTRNSLFWKGKSCQHHVIFFVV